MCFLHNLTVFVSALTLIAAIPTNSVSQMSVEQSPYPNSGTDSNKLPVEPGHCVNVTYNNIATKIRLISPSGDTASFRLDFSSTPCGVYPRNYTGNETLPQSGVVIVNRRKHICSFKLERSVFRPVNVTFYYGTDGMNTLSVSNSTECKKLCSSTETSLNYPHSVNFTRNGATVPFNSGIHLFTDSVCTHKITREPIVPSLQRPNNLVELTSETDVQVKSFTIEGI